MRAWGRAGERREKQPEAGGEEVEHALGRAAYPVTPPLPPLQKGPPAMEPRDQESPRLSLQQPLTELAKPNLAVSSVCPAPQPSVGACRSPRLHGDSCGSAPLRYFPTRTVLPASALGPRAMVNPRAVVNGYF